MTSVLIIEDDPAIALGLEELIRKENYDVMVCKDGLEGFNKAVEIIPDVILLDINLPSLNGLDICRKLRENKFLNHIIMLTSNTDQVDKIVGLEIGADDYITKPFDNREIIARIRVHLRKSERHKTKDYHQSSAEKYNRKLLTIMFTDIQNYSGIMNENESIALEILEKHNMIMNQCISNGNGNIIEITGDAVLATFESVIEAVICAVDVQKKINDYNQLKTENEKIKLRIGIHLGDVVEFDNKIKGDVVNIAARIQQNAKPGYIFISETVKTAVKNKVPFEILNAGEYHLKNIKEPLQLYSIKI